MKKSISFLLCAAALHIQAQQAVLFTGQPGEVPVSLTAGSGTGNAASAVTTTCSGASATFTATSNTINRFDCGLVATNVTSSTLASLTSGGLYTIVVTQPAGGGITFAAPTGLTGFLPITAGNGDAANEVCTFSFTATASTTGRVTAQRCDGGTPGVSIPGSTSGVSKIVAPATGGGVVTLFSGAGTVFGSASANTATGRQDFSGASSTAPSKIGTSPPGTCAVGDTFIDTDATSGSRWLVCETTNTWVAQGGSSLEVAPPYVFDGSNYYYNGIQSTLPNLVTWSSINGTGLTATTGANGDIHLLAVADSGTTKLRMRQDDAALGSSTFTVTALLAGIAGHGSNGDNCGLAVTDGTKFVAFGPGNFYGGPGLVVDYYATTTTAVAIEAGVANWSATNNAPFGVRISLAGGTFTFSYAADSKNFRSVTTQSATARFASTTGLTAGVYCVIKSNNTPADDNTVTILSWLEQ